MIKIATCQYQIEMQADWLHFSDKMVNLVQEIKAKGTQLLLLPEYAGIELCTIKTENDGQIFENVQL